MDLFTEHYARNERMALDHDAARAAAIGFEFACPTTSTTGPVGLDTTPSADAAHAPGEDRHRHPTAGDRSPAIANRITLTPASTPYVERSSPSCTLPDR